MIDLHTTVKAKESDQVDYSKPIPSGTYAVKIKEIKPWKNKLYPTISRKATGEVLNNITVYYTSVVLEVVSNDSHNGRLLFYNLTTHPNVPWIIPSFLYALGINEMALSEFQTGCVNKYASAEVTITNKVKTTTDKDTGFETTNVVLQNEVKKLIENEI